MNHSWKTAGGKQMRRLRLSMSLFAVFVFMATFLPRNAMAQTFYTSPTNSSPANTAFYVEVAKPEQNRIYVFNDPKAYQEFLDTGDIEKKITRIGEGPNGETMIFD